MISKYFSYNYNFDEIINNDPTKKIGPDYWELKLCSYEQSSWATDIFTNEELDRILVIGKRLIPARAKTDVEDCMNVRRSYVSWIGANQQTSWIYRKLTDAVMIHNEKFWNYDLEKIERIQFTQYKSEENGVYVPHIDPLPWNKSSNRKLSIVVQLSDPEDYEGGDLKLHIANNPTIIKKQKGMTVFFPSHTLHEVTPVTKGERYSLVAWVHGPNLK